MTLKLRRQAYLLLFLTSFAYGVRIDPTVPTFAGNAQHTAEYFTSAQDLLAVHWSVSINADTMSETIHYGAPVITATGTIIVPAKTAAGFVINAYDATSGAAKYSLTTDYMLPPHDWIPVFQPALAINSNPTRLYYPGAGGTVYWIGDPDTSGHSIPTQVPFYTSLAGYQANASAFNSSVFVNTPVTIDLNNNVYFGFRVAGTAPAPLSTAQSGFARIDSSGVATYVLAGTAAGDSRISSDSHNSAPALSTDENTLYVVVKAPDTDYYGYLLGLDATTLATKYKVFLKDPRNGSPSGILDNSTASPTVAPDGDVYFGVTANPDNGSRGFLLRFSGDLSTEKTPGGFGWDTTPGIVPPAMVPSYQGPSSYLIFSKYNDYRIADGLGRNKIAILDPASNEVDSHSSSGGLMVMREVMSALGPTPDSENPDVPDAVREWCIDTAAINPPTNSIFSPSEDGHIYRWNLVTNKLDYAVSLAQGVGEAYVPTVIGPDGTLFTMNGGTLFALGGKSGIHLSLTSSVAAAATLAQGPSFIFTAAVSSAAPAATAPNGVFTFNDTVYDLTGSDTLGAISTTLAANVALDSSGQAAVSAPSLSVGNHFITASYTGDSVLPSGSVTLVQDVETTAPDASASGIKAYPSPWRSDRHSGIPLTFAGLVPSSTVKVFTVSGRWVITLSNTGDKMTWDLKNDSGDPVASGLYLYLILDPFNHKTVGKFAVIR